MSKLPRLGVAAVIQNELDALPEWIAFHLAVGVEHFILADVGSRDGSGAYLRELSQLGLVTLVHTLDNTDSVDPLSAYSRLLSVCPRQLDLVAFLDVDEFLLPLNGVNTEGEVGDEVQLSGLRAWLGTLFHDPDVGALALNSACFGSSGERFRGDGLVIERFTQRASRTFRFNRCYKSVVRPSRVSHFENQRHAVLTSGHYIDSKGNLLQQVEGRPGVSRQVCWQGARINHYAVKSVEEFVLAEMLKRHHATLGAGRGDAYFSRFDLNTRLCVTAQSWANRVYLTLLTLPASATFTVPHTRCSLTPYSNTARLKAVSQAWWHKWWAETLQFCQGFRPTAVKIHAAPLTPPVIDWKRQWPSPHRVIYTQRGVLLQASLQLAHGALEATDVSLLCSWQEGVECVLPACQELAQFDADTCYFRAELPVRVGCVALYALIKAATGEQRVLLEQLTLPSSTPLSSVHTESAQASALVGKHGWLFLDQDTNVSLYQHLGYISLSQHIVAEWQAYADQLLMLSLQESAKVLMVVAPSKERVMHAYHPYPMGASAPVDQVLAALPTSLCLYPERLLLEMGDDAYHVTDTHWTQQAAMRVTCEAVSRLGLAALEDTERWFAEDQYKFVKVRGDLGSKLTPVRRAATPRLNSFDHRELKRYDNGLPNFGRVIVWENSDAFLDQCCLVFGASSSYTMFPFLVRAFRRVVFVHSAGNVDASLVRSVAAQCILVQTNARFMVRAPQLTWSLQATFLEKLEGASMEENTRAFGERMPAGRAELVSWGLEKWNDCLPAGWFNT